MWTLMLNQYTLILRFTMIPTSSIRQDLTWAWMQLASNSFTSILVKSTCLKISCIIRLCLSQTAGWIESSIQLLGFWDGREDMPGDEYGQGHDVSLSPPSHHYLQVTWSHFLLFCLIKLHCKKYMSFAAKTFVGSTEQYSSTEKNSSERFIKKKSLGEVYPNNSSTGEVILHWLGEIWWESVVFFG